MSRSQPILTRNFSLRVQIDIVDYSTILDGPYKYLLKYHDYRIKVGQLRPLIIKILITVAYAFWACCV